MARHLHRHSHRAPPRRVGAWLAAVFWLGLLAPSPTLAARPPLVPPSPLDGATERQAILQAQQAIARQFGGHKVSQHWRKNGLLMVWRTADGRRLLVRVNPANGNWQVVRRENSDR